MYEPVSNKADFPELEKKILDFWDAEDTFRKSVTSRKHCPEFVFYDGPPFATGLPHYGHLLAGTIKDIVPRYMAMRGRYVERRFGWDCHGLPVEYEVEQDLDISGKTEIEKLGVDVFNEKCRSIVLRYTSEWRKVVTRMGRWVDFDNDYKTMEPSYMESIWWVFKSLWDKGLIYEGSKILPYCPRCSTPLSNFETNQGYEDVQDPAITVRFRIEGRDNEYLLAWTTTPWTLPSNMALAVGPEVGYAKVVEKGAVYYLAKDRVGDFYKSADDYLSLTETPAADLVGLRYEPLFPYFSNQAAEGAFKVVAADFVSTEDGTGIVHIAPGFGEDDHALGLKEGLPAPCPIDAEGRFTQDVSDYAGRQVKEADSDIIKRLKDEEKLVKRSTIVHSYPHCWRCDTALIYKAVSTWFVAVEKIKERLIAANKGIHWVPEHIRDGRFGKWLEGSRDWAISRNRYWGAPLPVWRSEDGKELKCVGSIAELEELSGRKITDLHKHYVDAVEIPSSNGASLKRVPEVLDCWFESGSMPYAQAHYPFENKEHFERHFPADFIAEGLDQTRGWFYTLMILSVALFDKPAFRNVVVNGLVLAEDGRKMSKRLKNYPDPGYMIDTYGADALRLYMINSSVVRGEDLRFSEDGVKHLLRSILIPLWNAYSFFVTYARIDNWEPGPKDDVGGNILDKWIMSSMESLSEKVADAMDGYDLRRAVNPFVRFIDDLTNWYIRRSRRRFWKSRDDGDKSEAYATLHRVLVELSKVAAPFIPFISEAMYRNLRRQADPESVHLCDFPVADGSRRNLELERQMELVMTVVKLGRMLRTEHNLKVRQPLACLHVVSRDAAILEKVKELDDIVLDELNVKELKFGDHETDLAILTAKADFSKLGPKFGPKVKLVASAIAGLDEDDVEKLAEGKTITVAIADDRFELSPDEVVVSRTPREGLVVHTDGSVVVALETDLSRALILEGLAREFVNKVQNMRKDAGFEVTQRIALAYIADDELASAVEEHTGYITNETLAVECRRLVEAPEGAEQWDLNGRACAIRVKPVEVE